MRVNVSLRLALLAAVPLVNGLADNCRHCHEDACLKAIIGYGAPSRNGKADCNSYWLTTVTPKARTVSTTKTVTSQQTSTSHITVTRTISSIIQSTESVVETTTVPYTASQVDHETATTTIIDTVTSTITAQNNAQVNPIKRSATQKAANTPSYASVCGNTKAYETACSCIAATHRTSTAPTPVVTNTKTQTVTVVGETTQVATQTLTVYTTIATTFTWSTITSSTAVLTQIATTTDATVTQLATVTATETVAPSPDTFNLVFSYNFPNQENPNIYGTFLVLNGVNTNLIGAGADLDTAVPLTFDANDGSIKHTPSNRYLYHNAASPFSSVNLYTDDSQAAAAGGINGGNNWEKLDCVIADSQRLSCTSTTPGHYDAVWWFCSSFLAMVQPGFVNASPCDIEGFFINAVPSN